MENFFEKVMNGDGPAILKLATAWFLFFTVKYHVDLRRIAAWPSVVGNLTEFRFNAFEYSNVDPTMILRYNFSVDGQTYNGRQLAHIRLGGRGQTSRRQKMMEQVERVGEDRVVIHYNPRNPRKCLLLKPGRIEYLFLCALYLVSAFCAYSGFVA